VKVWEWNPSKYRPRCICGPDTVMRDSALAEVNRGREIILFGEGQVEKSNDTSQKDAIICPIMTYSQKKEFLMFHAKRYEYEIKRPEKYLTLVKSFESVHLIYCMDFFDLQAEDLNQDLQSKSPRYEFLLRNKFPPRLLDVLFNALTNNRDLVSLL